MAVTPRACCDNTSSSRYAAHDRVGQGQLPSCLAGVATGPGRGVQGFASLCVSYAVQYRFSEWHTSKLRPRSVSAFPRLNAILPCGLDAVWWWQIELVKITSPETSSDEHEALTQHAEGCLKVTPTRPCHIHIADT
jgi:hypothetical protein